MTVLDHGTWLLDNFPTEEAWLDPDERRSVSSIGPLAFALTYLHRHLKSDQTGGTISLAAAHKAWALDAAALALPGRPAYRRADVAPREMGKSTWKFLLVPMWAAAHGHTDFIAAFGDTASIAQQHLATFTHELQTNALLRADFPELCAPLVRDRGRTSADRVDLYRAASGFAFAARGMETQALGLKIAERRPDYILLDDIEPAEEQYSAEQVGKRLATLQDTILPLNDQARVELVGTVTRPDSIIHQLVKVARGQVRPDAPEVAWVAEDGWKPRYHPPILTDPQTGVEASAWPERWTIEHLQRIRHTRSYLKNFANDPAGADGDYWTANDFRRTAQSLPGVTRTLLSIDPAVTTKQSSDYTGLAVVEWAPDPTGATPGRCRIKRATRVKMSGADLRLRVLTLLEQDPLIGMVLVEVNQGGDVWEQILHSLPVNVKTVHQTVKKEVRAASVLNQYQLGNVEHAPGLTELENEQTAFPRAPHDDMVDAAGTGIAYFLLRKPKRTGGVVRQASYV